MSLTARIRSLSDPMLWHQNVVLSRGNLFLKYLPLEYHILLFRPLSSVQAVGLDAFRHAFGGRYCQKLHVSLCFLTHYPPFQQSKPLPLLFFGTFSVRRSARRTPDVSMSSYLQHFPTNRCRFIFDSNKLWYTIGHPTYRCRPIFDRFGLIVAVLSSTGPHAVILRYKTISSVLFRKPFGLLLSSYLRHGSSSTTT